MGDRHRQLPAHVRRAHRACLNESAPPAGVKSLRRSSLRRDRRPGLGQGACSQRHDRAAQGPRNRDRPRGSAPCGSELDPAGACRCQVMASTMSGSRLRSPAAAPQGITRQSTDQRSKQERYVGGPVAAPRGSDLAANDGISADELLPTQ